MTAVAGLAYTWCMRTTMLLGVLAMALTCAAGCGASDPAGDGGDAADAAPDRQIPPGATSVCATFTGIQQDCGAPCGECRACYGGLLPDGGHFTRCLFLCPLPYAIEPYTFGSTPRCCRRNPSTGQEECYSP